jgi:hypothetical protein
MKTILGLCAGILLVALGLSLCILSPLGAVGGVTMGVLIAVGTALLVTGIVLLVVFGVGLLLFSILALVGVVLLAVALPFLAPFFIVLIPIAIIVKLVKRG